MEKILIIDAINYLFRSYYAIGPMTNSQGQSTSALFGFIRSINKLIDDFNPDYIVSVFDSPDNKKSRRALYPEYKAHRKGAPEDLFPQIELAYNFCSLVGISTVSIGGVEADDTMASIAKWAREKEDLEVYLCTSDKDLFQVVDKNSYVILPSKNNMVVDSDKVIELFGILPEQMLDYLSIVGDASDNIPGLPGFGAKTAVALLQEFKTLDEILKYPEKVPGKKKQETLINDKDKAILSKKLATLDDNLPIPHDKKFYLMKKKDVASLSDFYQSMNFIKLLKELENPVEITQNDSQKENTTDEDISYTLINDEDSFISLIKMLENENEICIDTETTSIHPMDATLLGIGFCVKPKKGWYIPLNGNIDKHLIIEKIKLLLSSPRIKFYGHNIKYDVHILNNEGMNIQNIGFDTILASYLISPESHRHNLDILSLEYFKKVKISYKELTADDKNKNKSIALQDVDINKVASYCCEDVDYTCRLKNLFEKKLKSKNLDTIFYNIELPLLSILVKMERKGIFIDENIFKKMEDDITKTIDELEKMIFSNVGIEFNLNSPKQLSDILYNHLKLPMPTRKKTQYCTGFDILTKLANNSEIVKKIIKHRSLQKLLSTYVEALPKQINRKTLRIHPTFNQSVTATGRLSCQDPNLQNIPIRTKLGKDIRRGFRPEKEGWSYVAADYSQIELRLLAHFCEDNELLRAFNNEEDIHAYTASLVYNINIEQVTKEMRSIAKAVNFGILYGQGAYGLSQLLNIPFKEAQTFINTYFERYTKVKPFIEKCIKLAEETKISKTLFGRQRPLPDIDNKNPMIRNATHRLAVNTPLQGTAADIIKLAMIAIDKEINNKKLSGYMILQIHDELVFEVPDNEIHIFSEIVKEKMENVIKLNVPLTIDLQVGKNWGEC